MLDYIFWKVYTGMQRINKVGIEMQEMIQIEGMETS